jgi:hypothetical protein
MKSKILKHLNKAINHIDNDVYDYEVKKEINKAINLINKYEN